MGFFDKMSAVGQKTIAKTKEFADISSLTAVISEQEKQITENYAKIGKLYVDTNRDNIGKEYTTLIDAIARSEDRIEECKRAIRNIKNVKICKNCGAEIADNASFCNACGNKVEKESVGNTEY